MNIYKALGAQPETGFDCLDKYPYIWSDGSTNTETKLWAIKKLGFNDPRMQYESWCEHEHKLNVVPHTVKMEGIKCYPRPLSTPGKFDLEWVRVGHQNLVIPDLNPEDLYDAMREAKEKGLALLNNFRSRFIWTDNIHYDDRFELHRESPKHYWTCDNQRVAYVHLWVCVPFQGSFYQVDHSDS